MKIKNACLTLLVVSLSASAAGQSGGQFTIEKSVISAGGGTSSNAPFIIESTIGQTAPGRIQGSTFSIHGGFITPAFAPTAANVNVSGRVSTPAGTVLYNAIVEMSDLFGNVRVARTGPFGYYRFDGVAVGQTYTFSVRRKGFTFAPLTIGLFD